MPTTQKIRFSIKDFCSKCDQIRSFLADSSCVVVIVFMVLNALNPQLPPAMAVNGPPILLSELILKPQRFISTKNYYAGIRYCDLSITYFALLLILLGVILVINASKT